MAKPGSSNVSTGVIKRVVSGKGFGFIADGSGTEYFFHMSALINADFERVTEGANVEFMAGQGPKGPRAEQVKLLG